MTLFNYVILILWLLIYVFAFEAFKALVEGVFRRKVADFDKLNVFAFTAYKMCIILFCFIPWLSLSAVLAFAK